MQQTITIGGKKRPVNFGFNAIAQLERLEEKSMMEIFKEVEKGVSMHLAINVTYVGLCHGARKAKKDFKTSFETVGDWLDEMGFDGIGKVIDLLTESVAGEKTENQTEKEGESEKKS